jgi:proteasome lid subunit RPN8/RPN11
MTGVTLSPTASQAIATHAASVYPREACGVLIGYAADGFITRVVPCSNCVPPTERTHRFEIHPRTVINLRRALRHAGTGEAIVGFYHSHPDTEAVPSRTDLPFLRLWPETVWLISRVNRGGPEAPRAWWLDTGAAAPRELAIEHGEPALLAS